MNNLTVSASVNTDCLLKNGSYRCHCQMHSLRPTVLWSTWEQQVPELLHRPSAMGTGPTQSSFKPMLGTSRCFSFTMQTTYQGIIAECWTGSKSVIQAIRSKAADESGSALQGFRVLCGENLALSRSLSFPLLRSWVWIEQLHVSCVSSAHHKHQWPQEL